MATVANSPAGAREFEPDPRVHVGGNGATYPPFAEAAGNVTAAEKPAIGAGPDSRGGPLARDRGGGRLGASRRKGAASGIGCAAAGRWLRSEAGRRAGASDAARGWDARVSAS